jgi:hypothetical protein
VRKSLVVDEPRVMPSIHTPLAWFASAACTSAASLAHDGYETLGFRHITSVAVSHAPLGDAELQTGANSVMANAL